MAHVPGPRPIQRRWSRVWVTRPAAEAGVWVQALEAWGWPVRALPLIDIVAPQDPSSRVALDSARNRWLDHDALMFVSAAAVQHFFAGSVPVARPLAQATRFWAPGPGTARALAQVLPSHGLDAARIDAPPDEAAQFDSEHLWPAVATQVRPGMRLLVVRGASASPGGAPSPTGNGRDWLMRRCVEQGATVDTCVAYERHAPQWTSALRAEVEADAGGGGSLWLFSSSEALNHLREALPQVDWSATTALCTHDRIAATAHAVGFGRVVHSRPALPDVLRALEST